jgi:O-methyltransferase
MISRNFKEPYFIPANDPKFLADGESWVENNQRFRQKQKFDFYRNAMDFIIENDVAGSYFEFGVHRARTFTMVMGLDDFYSSNKGSTGGQLVPKIGGGYMDSYLAFDSFEGFPEGTNIETHPQYTPGAVATSEAEFLRLVKTYGQSPDRVKLITGFYDKSLTAELASELASKNTKASLITVDCNLYESYKAVFAWIEQFMQKGTVLYLDDFNTHRAQPDQGPRRAWNEFRKVSRFDYEPFLPVGWCGYSFIVC